MLRNSSTKSKILQSGLNGSFYSSIRCVHWFHSYKYAQQQKDKYELYDRDQEFGQDEITDKDRNPHLYWGIWQGRTAVQRVINQFGFSKELKPDKVKRDFEKFTYFGKLDALKFLQESRENYPWVEEDGDDAIGYNTDDGYTDTKYSHNDYGRLYKDASNEYKELILQDNCHGRPVYEWQVPYGLDEAFGYKEVSTAVDVLGNDLALQNLNFDWSVSGSAENVKGGTLLTNNLTGQKLLLCDLKEAPSAIRQYSPASVVMPCGADKLLTSVRGQFSPTSRTDLYGTTLGVAWTSLWMMSDYWPTESFFSIILGSGLIALNSVSIYRTFFYPTDTYFKAAFGACRNADCNVILGDWLYDDYDERQHSVTEFDEISQKINDPNYKSLNTGDTGDHSHSPLNFLSNIIPSTDENETGFVKTIKSIKNGIVNIVHPESGKKVDDVSNAEWMNSYRDAVNNRRLDLLAHVLNNVEGDKVLMPISNVDNISSDLVTGLLVRRLTGNIPINSSPMKFDENYERVGIEFV